MKVSKSEIANDQEIFFRLEKNEIIKSSDIRELVNKETRISPIITQIFDVYGSRVPYPFTVFDGIFRLDNRNPYEIICEDNQISLSYPDPLNNIDDAWDLNQYFDVLSDAIRCETKYAAVFLSSGWDSSSILASLVERSTGLVASAFCPKSAPAFILSATPLTPIAVVAVTPGPLDKL